MTDTELTKMLRSSANGVVNYAAARIEQLTADKRFILEERDRTFALMLARAEAAEADRDAAYARGYSDAETEISQSVLGQRNYFLHSQYENATDHIKVLTAERDRYRKALEDIIADCEADYPPSHGAIKYAARAALKGERHE